MISWVCPQCKTVIQFQSYLAQILTEQAGACQGCRAKQTFEQNPQVIPLFIDFWGRTGGWPQSMSWIEAVLEVA